MLTRRHNFFVVPVVCILTILLAVLAINVYGTSPLARSPLPAPELITIVDSEGAIKSYLIANGNELTIGGSAGSTSIYYMDGSNKKYILASSTGIMFLDNEYATDYSSLIVVGGGHANSTSGSTTVQSTSIVMSGGEVHTIYGGGFATGAGAVTTVATNTMVNITGGSVQEVYGGGAAIDSADSNVNANAIVNVSGNSSFGNIFGGGYGATVAGDTVLTISGSVQADAAFGAGGLDSQVNGNSNLTISGSPQITTAFGGGFNNSVVNKGAVVNVRGSSTINEIYGGGNNNAEIKGDITVSIGDENGAAPTIKNVRGANAYDSVVGGSINVTITAGTIETVYGGGADNNFIGYTGAVSAPATLVANASKSSINVSINGTAKVESLSTTIPTELSSNVYGGGNNNTINADIVVTIAGTASIKKNVYGGNAVGIDAVRTSQSTIIGNTTVNMQGGTVGGNVYGGGDIDRIQGDSRVNVSGGTIVGDMFGAGQRNSVEGNISVTITDGKIIGNVYGAGNISTMVGVDSTGYPIADNGNIIISISGGNIDGTVYGGGKVSYVDEASFSRTGILSYKDVTINITGGNITGSVIGGSELYSIAGLSVDGSMTIHPYSETADIQIMLIDGTVGADVVATGASRRQNNATYSRLNANLFVYINDDANFSGTVYQQLHDTAPYTSKTGSTTIVIENPSTPVAKIVGVTPKVSVDDIDSSIDNILRQDRQTGWSYDHWQIRGEVTLPLETTKNLSIDAGEELYIPDNANLIATEISGAEFVNNGYIITKKPTLDQSIETGNNPGKSNVASRIYRGDNALTIDIKDATYVQNAAATPLNASATANSIWTFLTAYNKVDSSLSHSWEKNHKTITGETSVTYTPDTSALGAVSYTANATATHNFESVPAGVLSDIQAEDTAVVTVTTAVVQPPATSSSTAVSSSSTASSSSSSTTTTLPPDETTDPDDESSSSSSSSQAASSSQASSSVSSSSVSSSSVTTTDDDDDDFRPEITPGGGITIPPGGSGGPPDNVTIDGAPVDNSHINIGPDGYIDINPDFFSTLEDGEYTLNIIYDGVEYEATIFVEDGVPTSAGDFKPVGGWSLFDLIITILSVISPIVYIVTQGGKKSKNSVYRQSYKRQNEEIYVRRNSTAVAGFFLFGLAFILLILTQDFTKPMIIFDIYSIWFAIIFIVQTIVEIVFRRKNVTNRPNFVTAELDVEELNSRILLN